MHTTITRSDVITKLREGAVAVEALPNSHYTAGHLPGAINLPHDQVDELAPQLLPDLDAEVIVYCSNADCPNSAVAARRLVELGYRHVHQYEAGKDDWVAGGLELETLEVAR